MPRPLTPDERVLLDALLVHSFPGVEELRLQAQRVEAKKGCECGCGTIDLVLTEQGLPRSNASSPVPAEGRVLDAAGIEVGGLLLFLADGRLQSLEVYSYDDPLPLPEVDQVRWTAVPR